MGKVHNVIVPTNVNPYPERFEVEAASIIAKYMGADATFLARDTAKTPDIVIENIEWEIKSPLGKSKHTIEEQVKRASAQSLYIIIDARRCKLHMAKIRNHLKFQVSVRPKIKRVLLINKRDGVEIIK
jgi:hypothetical protein